MELLKSLLLCLSFFFGLSSFTLAATYVVDKSGAGDFTTIQAAVNQAAALENMGPSRGYAYFVRASDMVYISGGLSSLQIGMLISVDDRNWYEIAQIVDSETIRITRPFYENSRFNNYKTVTPSTIKIRPGIYIEEVNMANLHFIHFQGTGSTRESVTIQSPELHNSNVIYVPFRNIEKYGHTF